MLARAFTKLCSSRLEPMAKNKRQHYVPQAYLRAFSDETGRALHTYNIARTTHIARASISGQCQLHRPFGATDAIDEHLTHVERDGLALLNRMRDHGELYDHPDAHQRVITYVLYQSGRTKRAADFAAELRTQYARSFFAAARSTSLELRHLLPRLRMTLPHPLAGSLQYAVQFVPFIGDLRPKLLLNESGVELITSDHPVVMHNQWRQEWPWSLNSTGLACGGLQLFLPLSPRVALVQYDDDVYAFGGDHDDSVLVTDGDAIRELNELQMAYAGDNLYYRSPAMRVEIDSMRWDRRVAMASLIVTTVAPGDVELPHVYVDIKNPPVALGSGLFAVRPSARGVPHPARVIEPRAFAGRLLKLQREG